MISRKLCCSPEVSLPKTSISFPSDIKKNETLFWTDWSLQSNQRDWVACLYDSNSTYGVFYDCLYTCWLRTFPFVHLTLLQSIWGFVVGERRNKFAGRVDHCLDETTFPSELRAILYVYETVILRLNVTTEKRRSLIEMKISRLKCPMQGYQKIIYFLRSLWTRWIIASVVLDFTCDMWRD